MERQVFPVADKRCHDSRKPYDRHGCGDDLWLRRSMVAARTNHRMACRRMVQVCVNCGGVTGEVTFLQKTYRGTSASLCGVSFISFVESHFLVRKLQRFLVTDIILYACLVCFMEDPTQHVFVRMLL